MPHPPTPPGQFSVPTHSSGLLPPTTRPPSRVRGGISLLSEPCPHLPGAASSPIQHQSPRRALARGWQRLPHGHPELVGAHPCGNSTARGVWMRPQQQSVHPDPGTAGHGPIPCLERPQAAKGQNWGLWKVPQPPESPPGTFGEVGRAQAEVGVELPAVGTGCPDWGLTGHTGLRSKL